MTIPATHSFILKDKRILLLKKANGLFGEGKWFVPGGKLGPGESPMDCVVRETLEETGLRLKNPQQIGNVHFFKNGRRDAPEWLGHVFLSNDFTGTVTESREGVLRWFDIDALPFDEMWEADPFWVGLVFARKKFEAWFYYTGNFEKLIDHRVVQL